ncbi:MAG: type II and III secretion system protein family protein, partial [Comamonas sp.]
RSSSLEAHALRMAADKASQSKDGAAPVDAGAVLLKSHVVQVDVKVVEINKNRMQQAGINLFSTRSNSQGFRFGVLSAGSAGATAFGAPGMLAPEASSPFAQAFGLLLDFGKAGVGVNLGMLEGSGMARVLAEPSLVTLSGQSANFLAGGEIPIPLSQ